MITSSTDLERLAYAIEKESAVSLTSLEQTFARAHLALAGYYRDWAVKAMSDTLHRQAGRYLGAAASQLEQAAGWSSVVGSARATGAAEGAGFLAAKLVEERDWTEHEFTQAIAELDQARRAMHEQMIEKPAGDRR